MIPRLAPCLICCATLAVGCSSSASSYNRMPGPQPEVTDPRLQPGDIVRVQIWREPELNGEFTVDPDMEVVLPLVGTFRVDGMSSVEVIDGVTEAYGRYLRNPSIDITVLRRISVQGEVRNPGLFPVSATLSIADLIAAAGGLTSNADANKIRLVREGQVVEVSLRPESIVERSPIRSGDQILVGEKPWLLRNSGIIAAGLLSATAIVIAAVIR